MLCSCKSSDPCNELDADYVDGKAIVSANSVPTGSRSDAFAYKTGFQVMGSECKFVFDDYTSEPYSTGDTVLVKNGYIIGYY